MNTEIALLGYLAWTLFLVLAIEAWRSYLTIAKGRKATSFMTDGEDVSKRMSRLCAAYYNCTENFLVFGGLMLLAIFKNWTDITDSLAIVFLIARVLQSVVHISSGNEIATSIRAGSYFVQLAIAVYWLFKMISNV